jgi:hypothetical protein
LILRAHEDRLAADAAKCLRICIKFVAYIRIKFEMLERLVFESNRRARPNRRGVKPRARCGGRSSGNDESDRLNRIMLPVLIQSLSIHSPQKRVSFY